MSPNEPSSFFDELANVREAWSTFVQAMWADRTYLVIALSLTWLAMLAVFVAFRML